MTTTGNIKADTTITNKHKHKHPMHKQICIEFSSDPSLQLNVAMFSHSLISRTSGEPGRHTIQTYGDGYGSFLKEKMTRMTCIFCTVSWVSAVLFIVHIDSVIRADCGFLFIISLLP
ncbi:hypothetical protein M514_03324 [Trichuris suis]|uniref:Uncharacterized protein n=1 Tax=Trichuris suis TaxID=68888 RepID=A0A085NL78_9BILA|nr:hypothetical protein M514_03324 [Trichuris suis]